MFAFDTVADIFDTLFIRQAVPNTIATQYAEFISCPQTGTVVDDVMKERGEGGEGRGKEKEMAPLCLRLRDWL